MKTKEITATKLDFLIPEKNRITKKIVDLEINIAVLELTDPNIVLARAILTKDNHGNTTSTRDITAKESLEESRHDLEGNNLRMKVIDNLIKLCV